MTNRLQPRSLQIPHSVASSWSARPDLIGAWVDVAMSGKDVWTEGELSRRWGTGWSQVRVRWWLGLAAEIGVAEETGRPGEWRIVSPRPQDPRSELPFPTGHLIASRHGQYYHRETCGAKAAMGARNVCIFDTPSEAVAQGYEPCELCHPPAAPSGPLEKAPFLRFFQYVSAHRAVVRYRCRLPKHGFDIYLPKSMISAITRRRWPTELLIGIAEEPALLTTYYFTGVGDSPLLYSSVQDADLDREYVHSVRYRLRAGPQSYSLYVQREALPSNRSVPAKLFMRFAVERDE